MIKQFFGREFSIGLIVIGFLYVFALAGYFLGFNEFLLLVLALATLFLTLANFEFGICLAFLELFSSPHGQLLSTEIFGFDISLRMAIFAAVMLGWGTHLIQKRTKFVFDERGRIFAILFVAIIIGFIFGALNNPIKDVFSDGNAYFYLLYLLPILSVRWTSKKQKNLLQLFAAGAVFSVAITFISLYIFSHFNEAVLQVSYGFLRDLRIAEITDLGSGFYRVFQQTHFFVIALLLFIGSMILQRARFSKVSFLATSIGLSIVLLSLSRSFWAGALVSLIVLIVLGLIAFKPRIKSLARLSGLSFASCLGAIGIILIVVMFPLPQKNISGSDLASVLAKRATETDDVAVSSRWKLLDPMIDQIRTNPLAGSGFGTEVTFESDDPRVRELNETGTWSTYAM